MIWLRGHATPDPAKWGAKCKRRSRIAFACIGKIVGCGGSQHPNSCDWWNVCFPSLPRNTDRASLPATLSFLRSGWERFLARAVGESPPEVGIARSPQDFVPDAPRALPASMPNSGDWPPGDVLDGHLRLRGKNRSLNPNRSAYPFAQAIDRCRCPHGTNSGDSK